MYREFLALKLILKEILEETQELTKIIMLDLRQITYDHPDIRNEEMIEEIYEKSENLIFLREQYKDIREFLFDLEQVEDYYKPVTLPPNIEILPIVRNELMMKQEELADKLYVKISRSDDCLDYLSMVAQDLFEKEEIPSGALKLYLEEYEQKEEDFNTYAPDIINLTEELHSELGEDWIVESKRPLEYWALVLESLFKTQGGDEEFIEAIRDYPEEYERGMY